MNLEAKYERLRPKIKNGAIALFRGSSALSKTIQWADDAYYNHSGLIFDAGGRLMILDSNAPGVRPEFLSERIEQYVDFCILNPTYSSQTLNNAVNMAIDKDRARNFKYDFMLLPKVLVQKKLGKKVNHNLDSNRTICSVFTGYHYAMFLGEYTWVNQALKENFITPEDHLRYISKNWEILI